MASNLHGGSARARRTLLSDRGRSEARQAILATLFHVGLYENWRLPTLAELQSILVGDKNAKGYEPDCGQWVKTIPEIELSCGWVWTSETDSIAPTARIFNFDNVYHYTVRKAHKRGYRALPVRNLK